jgi:flagellar hook-associated protein 1 FlgK
MRADLVATNVANATTPGYVRRSLTVGETILGNQTAGVQALSVDRSQNTILTAERRNLSSDFAQSNILSSRWGFLSQRIGDDIDSSALFQNLSSLKSAIDEAVLSPESTTHANTVVQSANNLVNEFNALSNLITQERWQAETDIQDGVTIVNESLLQVERLNKQISGIDRTTGQAAALLDERARIVDRIAEYLPVQTVDGPSGTVDILTNEGVYLLAGTARQIDYTPANVIGPNITLGNGLLSGISVDGTDITPGATSFGAVSSGKFGALFTLRDTDLPTLEGQLDIMAQDLIDRFASATVDPTLTPGDPGLFLDTDPAGGDGVAGRLQLNALVDPDRGGAVWRLRDGLGAVTAGPPGNNTILSNLSGAFDTVSNISVTGLQGGFAYSDLVAQLGSLTGQKRIQNESTLSSISLQYQTMQEAEARETGVDIETEMQDLLIIEQAYAANARVIQAASQMLTELMEI